MAQKIKVSAVSYTNTKPFIYGFELHKEIFSHMELSLDIPSLCADKLMNHHVDIGLIPVATLLHLKEWNIVSEYCIAANGEVNSVFIFSDVPIENATQIQLDAESRTSNFLAKVLFKFHWKLPFPTIVPKAHTQVLIGDRTFGEAKNHAFAYDLAEEWKKMTGLPFVFAAWISRKKISEEFLAHFNNALQQGVQARKNLLHRLPKMANFDLEEYLLHKIEYQLDAKKRQALYLFLDYAEQLEMAR